MQSDGVTSSKVYPLINWLIKQLSENIDHPKHSQTFKKVLLKSLNDRFSEWIQSDLFKLSSILDPRFGIQVFKPEDRAIVISRLKYNLSNLDKIAGEDIILAAKPLEKADKYTKKSQKEADRENLYKSLKYTEEVTNSNSEFSKIDDMIQLYCNEITSNGFICENPLEFWKVNENKYPLLATLAKKFLGVPASSASAERMFSIAGHIFSVKRRRMGIKLFERLVFLKLNEEFL